MNIKQIGHLVRQERKKKRLSQEQLARRAGLSRKTLSDIENGLRAEIGLQTLLNVFREIDLVFDVKPFSPPTLTSLMSKRKLEDSGADSHSSRE
ncbi:MAG: helix-turn-helix transcriptional regulator [Gammaproteobacteria bacterium]